MQHVLILIACFMIGAAIGIAIAECLRVTADKK